MKKLTQVLNILVGQDGQRSSLTLACPGTRAEALINDDAVGDCGSDKGGAVGEAGPFGRGVEGDVRQTVPQSAEEERHMSGEPGELEGLDELEEAVLERCSLRGRGRGHDGLRMVRRDVKDLNGRVKEAIG